MRAHEALYRLFAAEWRLQEGSALETRAEQALTEAGHQEARLAAKAERAERALVKEQWKALIDPASQFEGSPRERWNQCKRWWTDDFRWRRMVLRAVALVLAIGAAALLNQGAWLIAVVLVAAALALAALGVAQATSDTRFFWTGIALFASGLVFGAVFTLMRTSESPKLQPVGILLKADAGATNCRSLSGAYIARTDGGDEDAIWVGQANTVAEGSYEFTNGRITRVPNSRVVAYGIGHLARPYRDGSKQFEKTIAGIESDLRRQVTDTDCASASPGSD